MKIPGKQETVESRNFLCDTPGKQTAVLARAGICRNGQRQALPGAARSIAADREGRFPIRLTKKIKKV